MGKLVQIASMFGPFAAMKFWVSVAMAVIQFLQVYTGQDFGLDQQTVTAIMGGVWSLLVWFIPNTAPKQDRLPVDRFPPAPGGLY